MIINKKNINVNIIRKEVKKKGYFILPALYSKKQVNKIVNLIKKSFELSKEIKKSGHYKKNMKDMIRLDVGEYKASTRLARFFFKFPWNKNNNEISIIAEQLFSLRCSLSNSNNLLMEKVKKKLTKKIFCMSYIIQYPKGGGFMSVHREYPIKNKKDNLFVVYLALTTKKKDFSTGGAYVIKKGKEVLIEDIIKAGDVAVYLGSLKHGVRPIDQDQKLDLDKINGRMMFMPVINYFK